MRTSLFSVLTAFAALFSVISCVALPPNSPDSAVSVVSAVSMVSAPVSAAVTTTVTAAVVIEREKLIIPVNIMGEGRVCADKMASFLLQNNSNINSAYAIMLARVYIEESSFEGVNHDIAFVQMCLETGFLRFGGDVKPEQNNFCGLGAIGNGEPGLSFPDARIGVRAQIQHLQAYAADTPLKLELVNPRYRFVRRGSSPTIDGLAGTWAADRQYAVKIKNILQRLYEYAF